jgi:hypothetical protein
MDAKATMAVYKYKSEVMDRHGVSVADCSNKLLKSLTDRRKVSIIDSKERVAGFKNKNMDMNVVELNINNTENVLNSMFECIKDEQELVIGKIDILQPFLFNDPSK